MVEVDERVTLVGYTSDVHADENKIKFDDSSRVVRAYQGEDQPPPPHGAKSNVAPEIVQGVSGEAVAVLKKPNRATVKSDLQNLYDQGYRALAVVLMHSYTYPEHEKIVEEIAKEIGFQHISASSSLMPMIKVRRVSLAAAYINES